MSKTYLDQMDKAKSLVAGLKKNYEQVKIYGIDFDELSELENVIAEGEKLNSEVERLRSEVSAIVSQANQKLDAVKDKTVGMKRIVKQNFEIEKWIDFGVMDKR